MPQQRGAANVGYWCSAGLFGLSRSPYRATRKNENPQIVTAPRCFAFRCENTYACLLPRLGVAVSQKLSSGQPRRHSSETRSFAAEAVLSSIFEIRRRQDEGVSTHMYSRNGARNIGARKRSADFHFLVTFFKKAETEIDRKSQILAV